MMVAPAVKGIKMMWKDILEHVCSVLSRDSL